MVIGQNAHVNSLTLTTSIQFFSVPEKKALNNLKSLYLFFHTRFYRLRSVQIPEGTIFFYFSNCENKEIVYEFDNCT